jgi:hypothetical protein
VSSRGPCFEAGGLCGLVTIPSVERSYRQRATTVFRLYFIKRFAIFDPPDEGVHMITLLKTLSKFEAGIFIFVLVLLARGGVLAWLG